VLGLARTGLEWLFGVLLKVACVKAGLNHVEKIMRTMAAIMMFLFIPTSCYIEYASYLLFLNCKWIECSWNRESVNARGFS